MLKAFFISFLVVSSVVALFENTQVQILTSRQFEESVTESKDLWLINFYRDNEDSRSSSLAYEQAAMALSGLVSVGAVQDSEVAARFGVDKFPSILLFSTNREQPVQFQEDGTAENIVNFVFDNARYYTFERIGAKVPKKKQAEVQEEVNEDDVIVLDDDNFEDSVMKSTDPWIVEFYAPWCDHCKKLTPEWAKLATTLKGEVKVAKIDSSKNTKAHEKYKVKGYPSIKFFPEGEKLDGEFEDHEGARDAEAMATWTRETRRKLRPLFFEQLVSQEQFQQNCLQYNGICIVLFVPHLSECDGECRNNYLRTFKDAVLPHKNKPFNYFWSQGADQYDFEELFSLGGAGYPSVLAMSPKKQVWSKMRGSFSKDSVDRFIQNLIRGKEHVAAYKRLIAIESVKVWDGVQVQKQ